MGRSLKRGAVRPAISICTLVLVIATAGLATQAWGKNQPVAKQAKVTYFVETSHLTLTREEGSNLTEHGKALGTYNAPVTAIFAIHPKSVTATVTIYPRGGSISGSAQANYIVKNSVGYFGGSLTITHGTGKYSHISEVHGKAWGFSGTINRYSFAIEVKAHGEANV